MSNAFHNYLLFVSLLCPFCITDVSLFLPHAHLTFTIPVRFPDVYLVPPANIPSASRLSPASRP
eukprot:1662544-Pyramimonas_sp.AAC.1